MTTFNDPLARHITATTGTALVIVGAVRNADAPGLAGWLLVAAVLVAFAITVWASAPFLQHIRGEVK